MVALIVALIVVALIGVFLWWGTGLPPTRPRPRSRYRGHTYTTIHRDLEERRRR